MKARCKVVIALGEKEGERMILGVKVEGCYADERKNVSKMVEMG